MVDASLRARPGVCIQLWAETAGKHVAANESPAKAINNAADGPPRPCAPLWSIATAPHRLNTPQATLNMALSFEAAAGEDALAAGRRALLRAWGLHTQKRRYAGANAEHQFDGARPQFVLVS